MNIESVSRREFDEFRLSVQQQIASIERELTTLRRDLDDGSASRHACDARSRIGTLESRCRDLERSLGEQARESRRSFATPEDVRRALTEHQDRRSKEAWENFFIISGFALAAILLIIGLRH